MCLRWEAGEIGSSWSFESCFSFNCDEVLFYALMT